jgi:hypothetical protein
MKKWSGVAKRQQSSGTMFSGGLFVRNPMKIDSLFCPAIGMDNRESLQWRC